MNLGSISMPHRGNLFQSNFWKPKYASTRGTRFVRIIRALSKQRRSQPHLKTAISDRGNKRPNSDILNSCYPNARLDTIEGVVRAADSLPLFATNL